MKEPKVDFEWPTQAMLDKMPLDVALQSITLKFQSKFGRIGSVQLTLTNGE